VCPLDYPIMSDLFFFLFFSSFSLRVCCSLKERDDYLKEHEGHEDMHIEIFFVLVGVLTVTQIGMLVWRKHSPKSFQK